MASIQADQRRDRNLIKLPITLRFSMGRDVLTPAIAGPLLPPSGLIPMPWTRTSCIFRSSIASGYPRYGAGLILAHRTLNAPAKHSLHRDSGSRERTPIRPDQSASRALDVSWLCTAEETTSAALSVPLSLAGGRLIEGRLRTVRGRFVVASAHVRGT